MIIILFLGFTLALVVTMSATMGNAVLAFVAILVSVSTGVTMVSSRLVGTPSSFGEALRASMLAFVAAAVALLLMFQAAKGAPVLMFLCPVVALLGATWAVGHVLSLRWPHALGICVINALIVVVLLKTMAWLPHAPRPA